MKTKVGDFQSHRFKWRLPERRLDFWRLAYGGRPLWRLAQMAARTYGGLCDKWLLGHLAADKWRLRHLAAREDPFNMGQMAVGTFGGQENC